MRTKLLSIGTILVLVALTLTGFNVASATKSTKTPTATQEGSQNISAKSLTGHECNSSEWHFVITQVDNLANAPGSITVTWANGASETVWRNAFTGGTAHYTTTKNLSSTVTSATTIIYSSWSGQFNLSHGPCGSPTTEPTEKATTPAPTTPAPTTEPTEKATTPAPTTPAPTTAVPTKDPGTKPAATKQVPWVESFIGICKQWGISNAPYHFTLNGETYGPNPWGGKGQEIWFGGVPSQINGKQFSLIVGNTVKDTFTVVLTSSDKGMCVGKAALVPPSGSNELPPTAVPTKGEALFSRDLPPSGSSELPPAIEENSPAPYAVPAAIGAFGLLLLAIGWHTRN